MKYVGHYNVCLRYYDYLRTFQLKCLQEIEETKRVDADVDADADFDGRAEIDLDKNYSRHSL